MQKRMDFIVGFALWEHKTQNGYFIGQYFDQAAFFISECAGVGVPCEHCCEVHQCRRNVVPGGRMRRKKQGQNLKNVPPQNLGGVNILVFSESLW